MSNSTDRVNVELHVNGQQAQNELTKLKDKLAQAEKKLESLKNTKADPKAIKTVEREINKLNRSIERVQSETKNMENALRNLDKATPRQLESALKRLNKQLKDMVPGSAVWNEHVEKIRDLKSRLSDLRTELSEQQSLWSKFNNWCTSVWPTIDLLSQGYDSLVNGMRRYVDSYASMEQEMANVRKFTGMTEEQVAQLNEEFKNIDTRSSREELNKLAQEAGRLGKTSINDVLGFVRASDKINVALDDLGEGATLTLSKLTGIFGDEARYGTEQSLLKVGSVINELSQNCSASAPYLSNFAERMGGVGAQAKLTIPQIMGFAAVLDSNAQKVEASATALSQIIVRLYQDPAKYARVAGLDVQKFSALMRDDANSALLLFLETLQKVGGMDTLSPMFKDMGENGSRAIAALSTLATHIDQVKAQQNAANIAFEEGTSIDIEFAVQNNTVQASLDKCKNKANELSVELGMRLYPLMQHFLTTGSAIMHVLLTTIRFFFEYKGSIIAVSTAIAIYTAAVNVATIKLKLHGLWLTIVDKKTKLLAVSQKYLAGAMSALKLVVAALTNAFMYFRNGLNVTYSMQERWRKSMSAMSFGSWTALILALASAVYLLYQRHKKLQDELKVVDRIRSKAVKEMGEEKSKIDILISAANNERLALEDRNKAIAKLNSIIPGYNAKLDETSGKYIANKKALDDYLTSLTRKYELEGAKEQLAEIGREKAEATIKQQEAQLRYDNSMSSTNRRSGYTYTTSFGAVGNTSIDASQKFLRDLKSANAELDRINAKEARILKAYGDALQLDAANEVSDTIEAAAIASGFGDTNSPYASGTASEVLSDKERKRRELEARRALAKANLKYRDEMESAMGDWERAKAENISAYSQGLRAYDDYISEKERIDLKYIEDRIAVYESLYENEDAESRKLLLKYDEDYQELLLKKAEMEKKHSDDAISRKVSDLQREYKKQQEFWQLAFNDPSNSMYGDSRAQEEKLFQLKMEYLTKYRDSYIKNSKEWIQYNQQIEDENANRMLALRKQYITKVESWKKEYSKQSLESRKEMELAVVKAILDSGLISLDQYKAKVDEITRAFDSAMANAPSGNDDASKKSWLDIIGGNSSMSSSKSSYEKQKAELSRQLSAGTISHEEYLASLKKLDDDYAKSIVDKFKSSIDPITQSALNMASVFSVAFNSISKDGRLSFESIADVASAAFGAMTAGLEMYGQFMDAQTKIDVANITAKYDAEIEAAQGNSYMTAKLEKEKEKKIEKVKAENSKREFTVKVANAIANTAQSAILGYMAGLQAGFPMALWLAPALAGLATATGLAQVALIKKQQQAAAAEGYSEGGFTRPGRIDEPAGIVHAGEWVASQRLLANPSTRAVINALDDIQRRNVRGSIRSTDVSRSIVAPMELNSTLNSDRAMTLVAAALSSSTKAIDSLERRLQEPLVSVASVNGDRGIKRQIDRYDRLIKNAKSS